MSMQKADPEFVKIWEHFAFDRLGIPLPPAVLIGISRLFLYVHFPSDVPAAALLGTVIGTAAVLIAKRVTGQKLPDTP